MHYYHLYTDIVQGSALAYGSEGDTEERFDGDEELNNGEEEGEEEGEGMLGSEGVTSQLATCPPSAVKVPLCLQAELNAIVRDLYAAEIGTAHGPVQPRYQPQYQYQYQPQYQYQSFAVVNRWPYLGNP